MKTRDVPHCVSSLLRKLAMLAPTKKRKVSGRTVHAQFTRSTIPSADADIQYSTYSQGVINSSLVQLYCIQNSDTRTLIVVR